MPDSGLCRLEQLRMCQRLDLPERPRNQARSCGAALRRGNATGATWRHVTLAATAESEPQRWVGSEARRGPAFVAPNHPRSQARSFGGALGADGPVGAYRPKSVAAGGQILVQVGPGLSAQALGGHAGDLQRA